ncbi:putative pyridoxal-dependent aspartate 1-decarboxylase [Aestuariicella sp. G3-2]|uniref:pyridoxal-dependent aspartate 1-decarboxylase PanP n=1 Tax=Pseudomaricurvus albidus TaxID=2842452 RepID=UPI001C0AEF4C|nr:putative pyridoxal-dependent aspartate 1-decarboxylase [Aestuariicella albida]MBU3071423.1 putative pyridoxal-dependent aspartate 1-decarboxylase [Aestuariicella albida]
MSAGDKPQDVPAYPVLNIGTDGVAEANLESLQRIFTIPESSESTLAQIDAAISSNLDGFLHEHIVAVEKPLSEIETEFASANIPEQPFYVSTYTDFILKQLVSQSVHTSSPGFVGHMTSALPYFMLPLAKIVTALNQNLVKVETSKAFTPMERQVLGMLHRLIFSESDTFYDQWLHHAGHALGAFCSGGTVANITALWAARNHRLGEQNIAREGLYGALQSAGLKGLAVLISRRGHYSLAKAVDLLGLGRNQLVAIDTDEHYRVDVEAMRHKARQLEAEGIGVLSIVGLAGATETGSVDDLQALADLSEELRCHFHVDAAWGGATLFSDTHRSLLAGIERADSVTIDAHKQFYVPMGAGMVLFKDPERLSSIEHHAEYIIRQGSKDLGSHTLEGSRPGMALLVHAGLNIIGRKGYELLIDQGLERARYFASLIEQHPDFELVVAPTLNILGYRYNPEWLQSAMPGLSAEVRSEVNELLDQVTQLIQKSQRAAGKTFVSRTRVDVSRYQGQVVTVFRVVLANPLTTEAVLDSVLEEQLELVTLPELSWIIGRIQSLIG